MEIRNMSDTKQSTNDSGSLAPIIGFALGALVGGAVALLLAPASGAHTRRRIGNVARRMSRDARHTFEDARATVTEAAGGLGADVKSAIDAGREAFRHDGEPHEARTSSRIAQTLNPPASRTP
jgi:gas vesicle protein